MNTKCFAVFLPVFLANLFLFFYKTANAQQSYFYDQNHYESKLLIEFGAGIGAMNCLTDLGGNAGTGKKFLKDVNLKNTQLCNNFYVGAMYKNIVGLRLEAGFGNVKAYDSILKPVAASTYGRYDRNLSFKSSIAEIALTGEFHPLMLFDFGDKTCPRFSPYLLAGIGLFAFNPQAYFKSGWVYLHPLHLEGQGFKEYPNRSEYDLNAICYPVGLGVKYEISNFFVARLECIYRFTNTDYLDDDSQSEYINPELFSHYLDAKAAYLATRLYDRTKELNPGYVREPGQIRGNPNDNDAYFSINLKLGITLGRQRIR